MKQEETNPEAINLKPNFNKSETSTHLEHATNPFNLITKNSLKGYYGQDAV